MEQETDQMDVSIASLDQGELFNRSNPFRDESGRGRGRDGSGGGGGLQYGVELQEVGQAPSMLNNSDSLEEDHELNLTTKLDKSVEEIGSYGSIEDSD